MLCRHQQVSRVWQQQYHRHQPPMLRQWCMDGGRKVINSTVMFVALSATMLTFHPIGLLAGNGDTAPTAVQRWILRLPECSNPRNALRIANMLLFTGQADPETGNTPAITYSVKAIQEAVILGLDAFAISRKSRSDAMCRASRALGTGSPGMSGRDTRCGWTGKQTGRLRKRLAQAKTLSAMPGEENGWRRALSDRKRIIAALLSQQGDRIL